MNWWGVVDQTLADCVARLDVVLQPWGFVFEFDGCYWSHRGPYALGRYVRDTTRIGVECDRVGFGGDVTYQHSFITQYPSWRAIEQFSIYHHELMNALGHSADWIFARNTGDPVAALIHDLTSHVAPILREPSEAFYDIVRRGRRSYSVD